VKEYYNKIFSLTAIYIGGTVLQKAASFFLIPLYTSYLYPRDFGIIALMAITVELINKATLTPIMTGLNRFYYHPTYIDKNRTLVFNLFLLLIIVSCILGIVYWFLTDWLCSLLFHSSELIDVVRAYNLVVIFSPLSSSLLTLCSLKEKAKLHTFLSLGQTIVSFSVIIYLLAFKELGVLSVVYGNVSGSVFVILASSHMLWKNIEVKLSFSILREPLKFGYPMLPSGYSNLLIQSGDRYVLLILGTVSGVGLYSFGYTIAGIIQLLLTIPLTHAFSPTIRRLESNPEEQKSFINKSATYSYLVGMLLILALSLFSKELIILLAQNKDFWPSWVIVPIISFSYLQHALGGFLGWGMGMTNKAYHISMILIISAFINLSLNFLFIPQWNILGAAFATLISYIVWNGLKLYYSAKFYDLHFDLRRLAHITVVGGGLYLIASIIVNTRSVPLNLGIKSLILLSYPFVFIATGFFKDNELDYIRQLWGSVRKRGIRETYVRIRAM
jgi:O-antigen/teichoic acid export membrane protein